MAFKSVEQYNDDRYRNMFRITENGKSEDVIFLYKSKAEMLVGDVHYIRSGLYTGYVHCLGEGCPICALKKEDGTQVIRTQTRIFIPLYNIRKNAIEFWDRTMSFEPQFSRDVFTPYPNPSECVFRITRRGEYKDKDTRYDIVAVGRNSSFPIAQILAKFQAVMPDYYENVVKSVSFAEANEMLSTRQTADSNAMPDYVPIPRAGYSSSIPETYVNAAEAVSAPVIPTMPTIPMAPVIPAAPSVVSEPVSDTPVEVMDAADNDNGDETLPDPVF